MSHRGTISRRTKVRATAPRIGKYRESVRHYVESGASQPAAKEAEHALEGAEADELREAEEEGKAGGKTQ
jgi:hypothetical protein